ncbi:GHKL domain-containing protein [Psychromonas sp. RZ22]|uniref:ATP-binding protein n=1 Tax=Psychromonas algarum TaxID=2555643 RepID=UPI0010683C9A|nr:ATP-binding protein [Psychromonas sp. RZ22]TEW53646.1 GHKL domain-containing protein [Psychromonas sp. RZ22]
MKKLFISAYLLIIVTFFITVLVMEQFSLFSSDKWDEQDLQQNVTATSYLLDEIAQAKGQDHAEQALQTFTQKMHFQLSIYEAKDPTLNNKIISKIEKENLFIEDVDAMLVYFNFGNKKHIYKIETDYKSEFWQQESKYEFFFLLEICLALAVITFIVFLMLGRRLRCLEKVCVAFAEGDLDARASTHFLYRVGNLNSTLNSMVERIAQLIRSNRNLTNAVAHEFRTPIFRIQCNLDMLDDTGVRPEQLPYLEGVQGDLDELCSMVEELLHFAKMERLDSQFDLEEIDIHNLLDVQLTHLQFETDKKLILATSMSCYAPISVRPFQRAVGNIIRNGYRYAKSEVTISIHQTESEMRISIENDGLNIPVEDRKSIFEPFIRLEKSRGRQSGGHGLGLAIVKQIIKQHNGDIFVTEGRSGPSFDIILPLSYKPDANSSVKR